MELISRRKVLEYMADYQLNNSGIAMDWTEAIDDIFAEVEKMPTIESRPKGEWEYEFHSYDDGLWWRWKCSICGGVAEDKRGMNFCPNCGAYMRGDE